MSPGGEAASRVIFLARGPELTGALCGPPEKGGLPLGQPQKRDRGPLIPMLDPHDGFVWHCKASEAPTPACSGRRKLYTTAALGHTTWPHTAEPTLRVSTKRSALLLGSSPAAAASATEASSVTAGHRPDRFSRCGAVPQALRVPRSPLQPRTQRQMPHKGPQSSRTTRGCSAASCSASQHQTPWKPAAGREPANRAPS